MSFTLWVRYSNNQPVSLEFETGNVDKLKDVVKHKLTKLRILDNDNIILRKHEGTVDLEPDAIVDESFGNTAKTPLQVSITGSLCVGQHEREDKPKTFLVQSYNNEGEPLLGKFEKYTMLKDNEYLIFLKRVDAKGLQLISDDNETPMVVTSLNYIIPGETYQINAPYLTAIKKEVTWSKVEDKAIEDETLLAVKNFVNERFKLPVEIFPIRTMYKNNNPIMEWDGIIVCDNKVFLLESKHKMTKGHIESLVNRVNEFPNKLEATDSAEFKQLFGKEYIGVACSSLFPLELRRKSMEEGLVVVFPSGNRYKVEAPQEFNQSTRLRCGVC
ncbi:11162_t:CDS:2 [Paraglomus brasilianum]|uniref:11162_t:CDS:1 n=1 Tax=Paraglomus brasilianum TaxID=144538 RepID=A0A9N8VQ87_9GLOM|nr:11162_t:CDS:2 [Paraglomus brasilianum]